MIQVDKVAYLKVSWLREAFRRIEVEKGGHAKARFQRLLIKVGRQAGLKYKAETLDAEAELYGIALMSNPIGEALLSVLVDMFLKCGNVGVLEIEK